jgi:hypothetical protein
LPPEQGQVLREIQLEVRTMRDYLLFIVKTHCAASAEGFVGFRGREVVLPLAARSQQYQFRLTTKLPNPIEQSRTVPIFRIEF